MSIDKYRYSIYPDRIYVFEIDLGVKVELRGSELFTLLGLESYLTPYEAPEEVEVDKRYYL